MRLCRFGQSWFRRWWRCRCRKKFRPKHHAREQCAEAAFAAVFRAAFLSGIEEAREYAAECRHEGRHQLGRIVRHVTVLVRRGSVGGRRQSRVFHLQEARCGGGLQRRDVEEPGESAFGDAAALIRGNLFLFGAARFRLQETRAAYFVLPGGPSGPRPCWRACSSCMRRSSAICSRSRAARAASSA